MTVSTITRFLGVRGTPAALAALFPAAVLPATPTLAAHATMPAPLASQTVVESPAPRDPDLTVADEPIVRIGRLDGPMEYIFGNISGAIRLADGSVVVADEQSYEIRMYDAGGQHLWTSGRQGEGPGEYEGLVLVRGCPGAAITVFDWSLDRITELGLDGSVTDTRNLSGAGVNPYGRRIICSLEGDLVFTGWPDDEFDRTGAVAGQHYRWRTALEWATGDSVAILRSGIPGAERFHVEGGSGPLTWGRDMVFAAAAAGVWHGSADEYELELVDWEGRVTRAARWAGPNLEVTRAHLDRYLNAFLARYDDPGARRNFERERWPGIRDDLPERFPAYEELLALPDGSVWVTLHPWRSPRNELHLLDAGGVWIRRLTIPPPLDPARCRPGLGLAAAARGSGCAKRGGV